MKYLVCIKSRDNRQWRLSLYQSLDKLGFTHKPSLAGYGGYIVIAPNRVYSIVDSKLIDTFMFEGYMMVEVATKQSFIKRAKEWY